MVQVLLNNLSLFKGYPVAISSRTAVRSVRVHIARVGYYDPPLLNTDIRCLISLVMVNWLLLNAVNVER